VAPLEPWEKVYVNPEFLDTVHGSINCTDCHGGTQSPDMETAHTGVVFDPAVESAALCGSCHQEETAGFDSSLHAARTGYYSVIYSRSVPENHPALDTAIGNHCNNCHTTCSDCHISQPKSVGAGFLNGHLFVKTPPMTRTCTACHGSRVGNEYMGKNEGIPGDVHFRQERMACVSCHTASNMHASPQGVDGHRYEGEQQPSCKSCHPDVGSNTDTVPQHVLHGDKLSCQVCHSVTYTSCDNCHVSISEKTGNPIFKTEATYLTFLIGLNPRQSEDRLYEYVPLRHVPVDIDSFSYYGEDLLTNFDLLSTWAYATPHNSQRNTPQNASCNSCHGNPAIFLTADKVKPEELEANQPVIVPEIPAAIPGQ